ncbi:MAG: RNase P subunit p30 family protein [Candidatus Aenigmatarchaeota archaeon]
MDFYDLHVDEREAERMVGIAEKLGFTGLGITHIYDGTGKLNTFLDKTEGLKSEVDVISCCLIKPDSPEEMKKEVTKVRQKVEVVMIDGGDFDINRAAVQDSRIDVLLHPEYKRKDRGLDHKTTKMAANNDVAIGFVFHDLLQTYGKVRSHIFDHMKSNLDLCERFDVEVLVVSGAKKPLEMRDPKQLASLLQTLGFESSQALLSVSGTPKRIVRKNRSKLSGKTVKKGLEQVGDGDGSA